MRELKKKKRKPSHFDVIWINKSKDIKIFISGKLLVIDKKVISGEPRWESVKIIGKKEEASFDVSM